MKRTVALVVALTTATQTLVTMSAVVPAAISPSLATAFGVGADLIGFQIAIVYGAAMVSSTAGGAMVRRWGAGRIGQAALGLCAGGALLAMVPSIAMLGAGSVLIGIGYGLTNPSSSHLLEKVVTPSNRNLIYSIKQTGVPLGGILAGVVAPPIAVHAGWPWSFAVVCSAGVALIAVLQPFRQGWDSDRDPSQPVLRSPVADIRMVLASPVLRWLSFSAFFFAAIQLCLTTFAVALLVDDLAFGLIAAGAALSAVQAAGFVGRVAWGWAADRLQGFTVLMIIACLAAVGALLTATLAIETPRSAVYAQLLAFGFAAIGWNGVYLAEIARTSPAGRIGSTTGASLVFTFAGVLAGPPTFTVLYGSIGTYSATFGIFASLPAAGFALVLLANRSAKLSGKRSRPSA